MGKSGFASSEVVVAELMESLRMVHLGKVGQFVTYYELFQLLRQECEQSREAYASVRAASAESASAAAYLPTRRVDAEPSADLSGRLQYQRLSGHGRESDGYVAETFLCAVVCQINVMAYGYGGFEWDAGAMEACRYGGWWQVGIDVEREGDARSFDSCGIGDQQTWLLRLAVYPVHEFVYDCALFQRIESVGHGHTDCSVGFPTGGDAAGIAAVVYVDRWSHQMPQSSFSRRVSVKLWFSLVTSLTQWGALRSVSDVPMGRGVDFPSTASRKWSERP